MKLFYMVEVTNIIRATCSNRSRTTEEELILMANGTGTWNKKELLLIEVYLEHRTRVNLLLTQTRNPTGMKFSSAHCLS